MNYKSRAFLLIALLATTAGLASTSEAGAIRDRIKARAEAKRTQAEEANVPAITVTYGTAALQNMDIYIPDTPHNGARPVLVMVHGGAWRVGDKEMGAGINNKQAYWGAKGYIVISVNYRLLPEADVWTQAQDVAKAIGYIQTNIKAYGGDAGHMIVMGHSAGAHLIGLISVNPQRFNLNPWRGSVVLDTATMDIPATMKAQHYGFYDDAFGTDIAFWVKTSPIDNMAADGVPLYMVCSTKRPDKPCEGVEKFATAARAKGIKVQTNHQPLTHKDINQTLGLDNDMTRSVSAFIELHQKQDTQK